MLSGKKIKNNPISSTKQKSTAQKLCRATKVAERKNERLSAVLMDFRWAHERCFPPFIRLFATRVECPLEPRTRNLEGRVVLLKKIILSVEFYRDPSTNYIYIFINTVNYIICYLNIVELS
jgi:hypothetical protein